MPSLKERLFGNKDQGKKGGPTPSPQETVTLTPFERFAKRGKTEHLKDGRLKHEIKDGFLTARLEAKDKNGSIVSSDEILHVAVEEGVDVSKRLFVTTALIARSLGGDPWIPMRDPEDPTIGLNSTARDRIADLLITSGIEPFAVPGLIGPQAQTPPSSAA